MKRLTRLQAKAALGDMPERTFARLVTEGLPRQGDGKAARFPWPEIYYWLLARERRKAREAVRTASARADTTLAEAERREQVAKAELAELKLAELRVSTVRADVARRWFADACGRLRAKLEPWPRRLALKVTAATLMEREEQAREVFDEIRRELAAGEDVPSPSAEPGEERDA